MADPQFSEQFEDLAFRLSSVTERDLVTEGAAVVRAEPKIAGWNFEAEGDLGWFAFRLWCKAAYQTKAFVNAIAGEFNLFTAREESSVIAHSRRLGHNPVSAAPSRVEVVVTLPSPLVERSWAQHALVLSTREVDGVNAEILFENEFPFSASAGISQLSVAMIAGRSHPHEYDATGEDFQHFTLPLKEVIDGSVRVTIAGTPWTEVADLAESGPNDLHFITRRLADGSTEVQFGDGSHGARPAAGQTADVLYRVGGGQRTNVPANALTFVVESPHTISTVTNPLQAKGGRDRDSIDVTRRKAANQFRQRNLLGNPSEVAIFAEDFPGVARAVATLAGPVVLVSIIPEGGGLAPESLKTALRDAIDPRLPMGYTSSVNDVQFVAPPIAIDFTTRKGFVSAQAEAGVLADVKAMLNPLSTVVDSVTRRIRYRRQFGQRLYVNDIREVLAARSDVERDFTVSLPTADVPVAPHEITTDTGAITVHSRNVQTVGFVV
jgi:hypothetical protein